MTAKERQEQIDSIDDNLRSRMKLEDYCAMRTLINLEIEQELKSNQITNHNMKKYKFEVKEVHTVPVEVDAESYAEAVEKLKQMGIDGEYSFDGHGEHGYQTATCESDEQPMDEEELCSW